MEDEADHQQQKVQRVEVQGGDSLHPEQLAQPNTPAAPISMGRTKERSSVRRREAFLVHRGIGRRYEDRGRASSTSTACFFFGAMAIRMIGM